MTISFSPIAQKQMKKLPAAEAKKVMRKIQFLADAPLAGKLLKGKMKSERSLRAWPYRIIYQIEKKSLVILTVAHRQSAYA